MAAFPARTVVCLRNQEKRLGDGDSLLLIGKTLGHTEAATTARYSHLGHDPVRDMAGEIGRYTRSRWRKAERRFRRRCQLETLMPSSAHSTGNRRVVVPGLIRRAFAESCLSRRAVSVSPAASCTTAGNPQTSSR